MELICHELIPLERLVVGASNLEVAAQEELRVCSGDNVRVESHRQWPGMALRRQIILFGDSITQRSFEIDGWGAHMVNEFSRKADVVLRGYSGYNTRWAKYLLNTIFPISTANPPLLVTVFFGANDAALADGSSKRQHVPVTEYKENLHDIVSHLKRQSKSMYIVLITPPPVDVEGRLVHARSVDGQKADTVPERTNEATKLYADACETVAREEGVSVLNLWSILQKTTNWEEKFLCDGLHLTPAGNAKLFEEMRKLLADLGLTWDKLPFDFPEHLDIDEKSPAQTFEIA